MKTVTLIASILLIFLVGCKKPGHSSITISLKDGPAPYEEINIEVKSIEIYLEGADYKGWYKLNTNPGIYNILQFQHTALLLASDQKIPPGKTSQVRVVFGTDNSIRDNSSYHALKIRPNPLNEEFSFIVPACFLLSENNMLNILVDIDTERSVIKKGMNEYWFDPVAFSAVVNDPLF